jgi:hypothetical protein
MPKHKKVSTIPFNASPHQIDWSKANAFKQSKMQAAISKQMELEEGQKMINDSTGLNLTKNVSKSQISNKSNKSNKSGKALVDKSQDLGMMFNNSLNKLYGLKDVSQNIHNPAEFNPDSLFASNINPTQNLMIKDRKLNKNVTLNKGLSIGFKNSLSKNSFNSYEPSEFKIHPIPNQNPVDFLKNSLAFPSGEMMKITAKDFSHMNNNASINCILNDESEQASQNNSLSDLFNNDQTPQLFRGSSGVIDTKTFRRR